LFRPRVSVSITDSRWSSHRPTMSALITPATLLFGSPGSGWLARYEDPTSPFSSPPVHTTITDRSSFPSFCICWSCGSSDASTPLPDPLSSAPLNTCPFRSTRRWSRCAISTITSSLCGPVPCSMPTVFRVLPSCSATFLTSSTLWKSGVCAAVSPFAFRYRSESVFRSLLLSVLSRKNPLSNFSWPQLLASCLTDSADSRWPLKLNRSNACSYGFAAPVFGPWNPYFCIRPCMYFDAVSSPSDGLLRPFSASDARYSMCFIGSESSFSGGGGGGGWSDLGWMVRPQLLSVPTSWRAASWTVSFQSPATGSPANGVRSKLPLMSSAEPPCRFDTTADFPEGEVSVTTRSPRYVCEMSKSSL